MILTKSVWPFLLQINIEYGKSILQHAQLCCYTHHVVTITK